MQPVPTQPENVSSVYKSVLGREADPAGLAYWQGQVDKGMSLGDVAKAFSASDEYKNKPAQPTQPAQTQPAQTQPQSPQQSPQQGQQGGKAGGFGQPQQNPYQSSSPVFMPQVNQGGGAPQPVEMAPRLPSPYQAQNPYQGGMQNAYNQMMNPYMQQQRATPYQQQFQQQYNPLSYKPNMTQSNASLSRVKPSVYTSDLAAAQAKIKEYEDADAARKEAASGGSGGG